MLCFPSAFPEAMENEMANVLKRMFRSLGPERAATELEQVAVLELQGDGTRHQVSSRVKVIEYDEEPKMMVLMAEIGQFMVERLPLGARPHISQEISYHGLIWQVVAISAVFSSGHDLIGQRLTGEPLRPARD